MRKRRACIVWQWSIVYSFHHAFPIASESKRVLCCIVYLLANIDYNSVYTFILHKVAEKKINICGEKQVYIWYGIVCVVLLLSLDGEPFIILSLWHKLQWYTRYIVSIFSVDRVLGSTCFQADEFITVGSYQDICQDIFISWYSNHLHRQSVGIRKTIARGRYISMVMMA